MRPVRLVENSEIGEVPPTSAAIRKVASASGRKGMARHVSPVNRIFCFESRDDAREVTPLPQFKNA